MSVITYRNNEGKIEELLAIKGDKGDKGDRGDRGDKVITIMDGTTSDPKTALNIGDTLDSVVHDYVLVLFKVEMDIDSEAGMTGEDGFNNPNYNIANVFALKQPHNEEWGEELHTEFRGNEAVAFYNFAEARVYSAFVNVSVMINKKSNVIEAETATGARITTANGTRDCRIVGMYLIA